MTTKTSNTPIFVLSILFFTLLCRIDSHAQTGSVLQEQKISDTAGNFTGILEDEYFFGRGVASLGDLNGDTIGDLAVSSNRDGDGGSLRGAVWILFLDPNGLVKSHQKISSTSGGFTGALENVDWFGESISFLGDFDGNGPNTKQVLAVGAMGDDDGVTPIPENRGAVWLLFLNSDGTVDSHQKISDTEGNFTGVLDDNDHFARSICPIGDFNGDGTIDIAVGARNDDDGGGAGDRSLTAFYYT
jgi:hypothetical protein